MRAGQQSIDQPAIRSIRITANVLKIGIHLFWRGRQSNEIKVKATHQGMLVSFWCRTQFLLLQPGQNKMIDRIARPRDIFHLWQGLLTRCNK